MEILGVLIALAAVLAVPFLLAAVVLKVLFVLVLLPFKLAVGLVFGLVGGLFGLAAGGLGLLVGLFVLLMVLVVLPLTPLLLLGALVWLAIKAFSPAPRIA